MDTVKELISRETRNGNLMSVNVAEAWRKLTTRQFPNQPGRAFEELVSNAVDAYPPGTQARDVKLAFDFSENRATVTNWGGGMSLEHIRCLITIGGTSKRFDGDTIGQFGIGFCSIFNPVLETQKVVVTTRCDDSTVELTFVVEEPGMPPRVNGRVLDTPLSYATSVTCVFDNRSSVSLCRRRMEQAIEYYPYSILVNGKRKRSIWEGSRGSYIFTGDGIHARLSPGNLPLVNIFCRYVEVTTTTINGFLTGGHGTKHDLRDFRHFPWYPALAIDINIDRLSLSVSRNQFALDSSWTHAKKELAVAIKGRLLRGLADDGWLAGEKRHDILWSNLYVFREQMGAYAAELTRGTYQADQAALESVLFESPVFDIVGKREKASLKDLVARHTAELPVFYCREEYGKSVLGGRFKHDFIIVAPAHHPSEAPLDFFHRILKATFTSTVVDLDTLHRKPDVLRELVRNGVVDGNALVRRQRLDKKHSCDSQEQRLLAEINAWVQRPRIRGLFERNLKVPVSVRDVHLFDAKQGDSDIVAALFDANGEMLSLSPEELVKKGGVGSVHIGLNARSLLWSRLKESKEAYRIFYIFSIIVRELTLTQKVIPFSARYFYLRSGIESELVDVLKEEIAAEGAG